MGPTPEPPSAGPGTVVAEPQDDAAHIYDQSKVHTFDVDIAPADLALVDSDPSAEQYVPATLRFEAASYPVGYRYKGSIGAFGPPCTQGFQGPKVGKCSIKLSFNWRDPDARFHGLRKLVFHAMNNDPSLMRERLGYALFRAMGVPAPRATHAILRVNGQAQHYALLEDVDGRFTRSRFSEGGEGNLYKEVWPVHDDAAVYLAALETNEDQMPSVERMLRFKDAVGQGPDAMAPWLDPEVMASYMAVDRVIMNDDGAFHFYCIEGGTGNNPTPPGNHNYYWYEAQHADRMWIVPWDLDHSMNEYTRPPHIARDWRATPSAAECTCARTGGGGGRGMGARGVLDLPAPACDPLIANLQSWQARYDAAVDAFIAGPFSKQSVDDQLDRWSAQIAAAGFPVQPARIEELKAILDRARSNRGYMY